MAVTRMRCTISAWQAGLRNERHRENAGDGGGGSEGDNAMNCGGELGAKVGT